MIRSQHLIAALGLVCTSFLAVSHANAMDPRPQPPANTHQLTRAEVRHELEELEAAGFDPASDIETYSENLQAAERKVAAKHQAEAAAGIGASGDPSQSSPVR